MASLAFAQATTEHVVIDRQTGYAIGGFDPVAYFTDGGPHAGRSPHETLHGKALWRFRNEGNLIAFKQHPSVYQPLFGGYDPLEVARGKAIAGRPGLWAVLGTQLMLFSTPDNREALLADPKGWMAQAALRWPQLRQQLSP